MKRQGKLIVIDGTDGSGKATQFELLVRRLKKEGQTVKTVDFPEYYSNFFGKFIGECLSDKKYGWLHMHPKVASIVYAADRFEAKKKMDQWLTKGYVVLANRYVSANQIHQGGKIQNAKERREFLTWLDTMEHTVFGIPRPDAVFYLSLPLAVTKRLIAERDSKAERGYKGAKNDVHESDPKHLENARKSALKLVGELSNFIQIDCAKGRDIRSREEIHEDIYAKVKKLLK